MQEQLKKYPVRIQIPVAWGDMDAAAHVNNTVYLKWGETARIAYFEAAGIDIGFKSAAGPILAWQDCKYIFPMTFPDTAVVGIRCTEIQSDRLFFEAAMFTEKHGRIAAINKFCIVPYDFQKLVKVEIPEAWLRGIEGLEGGEIKSSGI